MNKLILQTIAALVLTLGAATDAFAAKWDHVHITADNPPKARDWYLQHFGGEPLLCANYQMLYAGMRKHADKYGEKGSHYVKSLSRSKSQKSVYWDALALFVEDMQHH